MENTWQTERVLHLNVSANFRDFGGYATDDGRQVAWGKLYRSATLSRLSDADVVEASKLGLNRIFDLRTDPEINREGYDRIYPGNEDRYDFLHFGYGDPYLSEAQVHTELAWDIRQVDFPRLYVNMLEQNRERIRHLFGRFADPAQYPVLIHCTQGKDRTGIVVALLLLLLGVPRTTIMEDYMLTGKLVDWQQKRDEMVSYLDEFDDTVPEGVTADDWAPFFTCLPDALENLFDHLEAGYNGITGFLDSTGIDLSQQKIIRNILFWA
jgi:protein-tyrosine phosphatase